jgi:hypothetical protein
VFRSSECTNSARIICEIHVSSADTNRYILLSVPINVTDKTAQLFPEVPSIRIKLRILKCVSVFTSHILSDIQICNTRQYMRPSWAVESAVGKREPIWNFSLRSLRPLRRQNSEYVQIYTSCPLFSCVLSYKCKKAQQNNGNVRTNAAQPCTCIETTYVTPSCL